VYFFYPVVPFSVLNQNIFTDIWNTDVIICLTSEGKVTEEAGVALTIQNSTADVPGFNVRRVNAHSKVLLCDFPRPFQANAGTVPRFGQDRLIQNRSDQLSGNHPAFDGKQPELLNVSLKKAKASCSRSHYVTHYM
jgi:hypothetical protein